jgi:iron-sulfur cluster insertion protein
MSELAQAMMLTDRAAAKVRKFREGEANPNLKLRVYITGGGCSGFSYGFTFDEKPTKPIHYLPNEDVTMLVDSLSFQYLVGSEVDYVEGLEGSRFIIKNPNATTTCGCGSSFSV